MISLPRDKFMALIVKLNKLTSLGEINWNMVEPPHSIFHGTDDYIPLYLETSYKDQKFAIYQLRSPFYDGEDDKTYWNERIKLIMLDYKDRVLWENPSHTASAVNDLFETARKKASNIEGIVDNLLSDDTNGS